MSRPRLDPVAPRRPTLPHVPGITICDDRSETAPRAAPIRRTLGPVKGVALRAKAAPIIEARIAAIREALRDG